MTITDIIAKKRDKHALTEAEILFFVQGATDGSIADYQTSALLMAIYLNGMDGAETAYLTKAMAHSGKMLDLSEIEKEKPVLDKHSTGGVGDKVSLIVIPILAACGIALCKMSGRGLGHTGGTLDKLEAIEGFRISLSESEMLAQVRDIGVCLVGQTADLAPADKKLYALRDVTATVGSLPLIVASILSKKLAGGASSFLFDVKVGDGALMKTEAEARQLAQALVDGAKANGRRAVAILSDMSQPLGRNIGNALEVQEAIDVLTPEKVGDCDARLVSLCERLAIEGVMLALGVSGEEAGSLVQSTWHSGRALAIFHAMVTAQGGDGAKKLPASAVQIPVYSQKSGYISSIATEQMGEFVVSLGGGRKTKEDTIDPAVGVVLSVSRGDLVKEGDVLAIIHANNATYSPEMLVEKMWEFYRIVPNSSVEPPLIQGRLE
jgi:pyrimidine-nucleoside phosphorylase